MMRDSILLLAVALCFAVIWLVAGPAAMGLSALSVGASLLLLAWSFGQRVRDGEIAIIPAQGMEAPSGGETGTGSTEGESPVREADAPENPDHPTQTTDGETD